MERGDAPGGREEAVRRVLTRDAALDRPPTRFRCLREGELLPRRDAELPLHEIEPRHQLGHGMLHLDARVHLEEVEVPMRIEEELAGAGVHIAGGLRRRDRGIPHPLPQLGRHRDARRLLDHLLMAALDRTLALPHRHTGAVRVSEDLDLHVTRPLDVLLDVDRIVAEGILCLALRRLERARDLGWRTDHAHPLPAPTRGGLEEHGIAELRGEFRRLGRIAQRFRRAGHHRRPCRDRQRARRRLGAHRRDRLRRGADPDQPRFTHRTREPLALGEKAIPGVDRISLQLLRDLDQMITAQIALARRRGADQHRTVSGAHMRCPRIGLGVDRDRLDPQLATGARDPHRDLPAVGDEDAADRTSGGCRGLLRAHSGMHPCFLAGFRWRFPWSASSASIRRGRVSRGSITSST